MWKACVWMAEFWERLIWADHRTNRHVLLVARWTRQTLLGKHPHNRRCYQGGFIQLGPCHYSHYQQHLDRSSFQSVNYCNCCPYLPCPTWIWRKTTSSTVNHWCSIYEIKFQLHHHQATLQSTPGIIPPMRRHVVGFIMSNLLLQCTHFQDYPKSSIGPDSILTSMEVLICTSTIMVLLNSSMTWTFNHTIQAENTTLIIKTGNDIRLIIVHRFMHLTIPYIPACITKRHALPQMSTGVVFSVY